MARARKSDEHDVYAASRSSNFVYVMNDDSAYRELDAHCDTSDTEPRLPLVVKGKPGSGKSALLANWVRYRREKPENKHEFLFEYFADCSSNSLQLRGMLHRLISALKDHFNLREMEVPTAEMNLRWSLIRFIEAAAKKYQNTQNARMVIVLDGVDRLQSAGSPDGTLKWLPTQLPASVRFVVSTVEHVPNSGQVHRSFQELRRRQCPELEIAPLTKDACIGIMEQFGRVHYKQLELDRDQQARVMDAGASQQPLFLRALLDSLRIGVFLLGTSLEDQLERSLSKETPEELISFLLGQWTAFFDAESSAAGGDASQGVLGWVLSLLFVSRHGLSDREIQGAVTLAKYGPSRAPEDGLPQRQMDAINTLLKDMTMEVDGIRRFANASLSNAVWEMYIKTPERRLQLHALLGRFFMQMEPCDRKLHELPYHLEIAGQWSKLKHALIKIEMFKCWWTPRHKEEFIKLWASLSKHPSFRTAADGYVTSNLDPALYPVPNARPCYDMVAEYIKALDEFVGKFGKPEEEVAEVAIRVADFLLEFATSGFEVSADAPRFSRPELITSDLASLGVPFLQLDDNGRSCLNVPLQRSAIEAQDDPDDAGAAPQRAASDQMPTCTTYNYRRWMWTQFPLVALANCGERFKKGVLDRWPRNDDGSLQESNDVAGMLPPALEKQLDLMLSPPSSPKSGEGGGAGAASAPPGELDTFEGEESEALSLKAPLSMTASQRLTVLPRLPPAKVSGHHSKLQGRDADRHAQYHLKVQAAQAAVSNDRAALDNLVRQRNVLQTQIAKMKDEYGELSAAEAAATDDENYLARLTTKHRKLMKQQANADLLSRNYRCVLLMCQRHPPRSDVLIEDLENQMVQDQLIINAVQQRSATAAREAAATATDAQALLKQMEGNAKVQHEILENLHVQRESLWSEKEQRRNRQKKKRAVERRAAGDLDARQEQRLAKKDEANRAKAAAREREATAVREQLELWDHRVQVINDKTGISDPQVFFEKFTNRDVLEKQMEEMKKAAEARLAELKKGAAAAESELEEVRYGAFAMNGSSRELRDKDAELAESAQRLKRAKERFESMQSLLHGVTAGAQHIGEIVGIQKTKGQQQSTQETLELLEQLLTELLDEEEDGGTGAGAGAGGAGAAKGAASPTKAGLGESIYDQEMEQRAKEMIAPHLLLLGQGDDATPSVGSDDEDAPVDLWGQGKADKLNAVPSRDAMKASSKKEVKDMMRGQSRRKSVQGGKLSTS